MGRRATFTQAELERAIRAARAQGMVALQTAAGIAFVPSVDLPQTAQQTESDEVDTCAGKFGRPR